MRFHSLILVSYLLVATAIVAHEAAPTELVCKVCVTDYKKFHLGSETTTERIDCIMADEKQETIQLHFESDSDFVASHADLISKETLFVAFSPEWVVDDSIGKEHQNAFRVLSHEEVLSVTTEKNSWRRLGGPLNNRAPGRRNLSTVGGQQVAAVVLHTADMTNPATIQTIDRLVYQEVNNQFQQCSNNAMSLVKKHSTLSVELPENASAYTSISVAAAGRRAVCLELNLPISCSPVQELQLDNILYIAPFGLSDDTPGSMWAYASTGDSRKLSVYTQEYFVPSTIMHEMAHNYMLGHAVEGSNIYGDSTGLMGGGWNTERCFNGMNMYVLGWYESETLEVTLTRSNSASLHTLKSVVDSGTGGIVNIKVGRYYLTYNMAKSFNSQTEEYLNAVLVHEGIDVSFGNSTLSAYSHTNLTCHLSTIGDNFSTAYREDTLVVELCSIDKVGTMGATLSIGLGVGCSFSDVKAGDLVVQQEPTAAPTITQEPTASGPIPLTDGELQHVSGEQNTVKHFLLVVSPDATFVNCTMYGGTGEGDLMANWFSPPALFSLDNDCYQFKYGNDEHCYMPLPLAHPEQSLYVSVHCYRRMSNVALLCHIDRDPQDTSEPTVTPSPTTGRFSEAPSTAPTSPTNEEIEKPTISTSPSPFELTMASLPSTFPSSSSYPSMESLATSPVEEFTQRPSTSFAPTLSPVQKPLQPANQPFPFGPNGESEIPDQYPESPLSSVNSSGGSIVAFVISAAVVVVMVVLTFFAGESMPWHKVKFRRQGERCTLEKPGIVAWGSTGAEI